MKGVFELRDHRDLLAKLERDLESLTDNPRDSDAAFNFFVTAWPMLEWAYPGNENKAKRDSIRESETNLRICEHIAVGAKHFKPTAPKHDSVTGTFRDDEFSKRLLRAGHVLAAIHSDRLMIKLGPDAAAEFGRSEIPAAGFGAMVLDYWKKALQPPE